MSSSIQSPKKLDLAVITGASSGIGLATAKCFIENGIEVLNLSRRSCPLKEVQNISLDFSQDDWQKSLKPLLGDKKKKVMCLIHNASLLRKDRVDSLSGKDLGKVLKVNVEAPQELNQFFLSLMDQGSSILYVGSTLSHKAVGGAASYVISKHAQLGLMRATVQDLAGTGIHSLMVCPGFTDTEMLRAHVGGDASILEGIAKRQCFNRLVKPEEIARVLFFSSQNPSLNGALIDANLGQIEL